jgi:hypothetical protein
LLLPELLEGELGLGLPLGEDVEPELAPPDVLPVELPLAAEEGLFEALEPEPALWSRLQPASATARDAARMASSLMNPP